MNESCPLTQSSNKTTSSSLKRELIKFTLRSFQSAAFQDSQIRYLRYARGLLCAAIRQRLLEDNVENDQFWEQPLRCYQAGKQVEINTEFVSNIVKEEINEFVFPDSLCSESSTNEIINAFDRRANIRVKAKVTKNANKENASSLQYFDAVPGRIEGPSISAIIVDQTPEQLERRILDYINSKRKDKVDKRVKCKASRHILANGKRVEK